MGKELRTDEKHRVKRPKPAEGGPAKQPQVDSSPAVAGMLNLQHQVGNRAVQRLLAQRDGGDASGGAIELDDEMASRINRERGGGQQMDSAVQADMGQAMGRDFDGVRVHTSTESDDLNRQLGAKAFTTGKDVFFRQGAYDPASSGGQELIAHELTHVAQQSSGLGGSQGRMMVNAPGDAYERQADAVSKDVTGVGAQVQKQEEEEQVGPALQKQEDEEQIGPALQKQEEEEQIEPALQKQEEEEQIGPALQKQEDEEPVNG